MKLTVLWRLVAWSFFGACSLELGASTVILEFRHTFNSAPLLLDSIRYPLASGESLSVSRLSYLLSGFALEKADGSWTELPHQFAWIDAGQRRTAATLTNIPSGKYRALRFAVGLDAALNHADPAQFPADHPLNPNLNGLHWSWQGGYIFLALEGHYRTSGGQLAGYSYHFANDWNRVVVTLPVQVDLISDKQLGIDFDIGVLLHAPRSISIVREGQSTHSREGDLIAAAIKANLPSAFQIREVLGRDQTVLPKSLTPLHMPAEHTPYPFRVSGRFPIPSLPSDNPLIEERVALGKRLFSDPLLSRDNTISCSSCHDNSHAFGDSRRLSLGVDGQSGGRNSMPLFNLAWKQSFFWDGRAPSLRTQVLMPIQDHLEMDQSLDAVVHKLKSPYATLFTQAFGSHEITPEKIALALENYLLTLTSYDSKFDRAMRGQAELTADEQRGFELFFTEYEPRSGRFGADCFHCHGGALFTDHQFHNNGLGDTNDLGRYRVTGKESDKGKFATPSLRNVALTAPYMHDGRFQTLEEVIGHYTTGVKRTATLDPNLAKHPDAGIPLTKDNQRALLAFLRTLSDEQFQTTGN